MSIIAGVTFGSICVVVVSFAHPAEAEAQKKAPAKFARAEACAGCHASEADRWKNSHHAKAMQEATPTNVLGDFANATLAHDGVTTTFSRDGEKFKVRTEGPIGTPQDYEIAYTFGVYPLQQYLIAFPSGRYQALGLPGTADRSARWLSILRHSEPKRRLKTMPQMRAVDPLSMCEIPRRC